MTGILPAISMGYAIPDTANAWGKFLRRYAEHQGAIGIEDRQGDYLAVVIPRFAALAMFPNPKESGWPLPEFKAWAIKYHMKAEELGIKLGYEKTLQGLGLKAMWFLHSTPFRGLLLSAGDYQHIRSLQSRM